MTTTGEVNDFHRQSDVDSSILAQHHTLGNSHNQAAPGDIGEHILDDSVIDGVYYSAETAIADILTALSDMGADISGVTTISPPTGGGAQGPPGPTGPAGPQGPKGDPGASITGPTGPQGPTGATGPTGPASTVPGPAGSTGPAGTPGEKWFTGTGAPTGGVGIVGDWWLDDLGGNVYEKTGTSTWVLRLNLKGPTGATGAASTVPGPAGATGATGPAGPTGATGPQGPQGIPGQDGISGGNPVGTIIMYGANPAAGGWPTGYLRCDGAAYSRPIANGGTVDTYAALFAVIGTAYGAGDGTTTFNAPNFGGTSAVPRWATPGTTGGATTHSHTISPHSHSVPSHVHTIPAHSHGLSNLGWAQIISTAQVVRQNRFSTTGWTANVEQGTGGAAASSVSISMNQGVSLDGKTDLSAALNTGGGDAGNTGPGNLTDTNTSGHMPPWVGVIFFIKY